MTALALVHGALGDTVLLEPALARLAHAGSLPTGSLTAGSLTAGSLTAASLTVWGPSRARLMALLAPRGPAREVAAWPASALALWGDGPLPEPLERDLRRHERLVAFTGPGPLAERVTALGGACVAPPRLDEALAGHAGDVVAERFERATGLALARPAVPRLTPAPGDVERGRRLAGHDRFVLCHPGSGGARKRWAAEGFARVLERVPLPALVVTGPAEEEALLELAPVLACAARHLHEPAPEDLLAALAGAAAYLGNDAGPTHLAAALGTPTVGVFGPTDPAAWGPRGRGPVRVVAGPLDRVEPRDVADALAALLGVRLAT